MKYDGIRILNFLRKALSVLLRRISQTNLGFLWEYTLYWILSVNNSDSQFLTFPRNTVPLNSIYDHYICFSCP